MIQRFARGNEVQKLRPAFTLVELLVVISIIGLLIAIALPAFSSAKERAKSVASQATMNAIGQGLQIFRAEAVLGGSFPPSRSDIGEGESYAGRIKSPVHQGEVDPVRITGASLLVYALSGPDDEGTAGFRDINGNGYWADDMSGELDGGGLYDPNGNEPRYGPYIDASLMEEITELGLYDSSTGYVSGLIKEQKVRTKSTRYNWYSTGQYRTEMNYAEQAQRFFVDKFRRPILYYKARKHAQEMVQTPGGGSPPGTFDHRDNSLLTGGLAPGSTNTSQRLVGTGFAQDPAYYGGNAGNSRMHDISVTFYPGATYFGEFAPHNQGNELQRARRFDNFIVRKSSRGKAKAVNSDTYLLISAGPDGIYGSEDDVTNWSR